MAKDILLLRTFRMIKNVGIRETVHRTKGYIIGRMGGVNKNYNLKGMYHIITSEKYMREHPEYRKECEYIKNAGRVEFFNYTFKEEYTIKEKVHRDEHRRPYFKLRNHKLFFNDNYINQTDHEIEESYAFLCSEQDAESPHCYFADGFYPAKNDVFVDVGCAEAKEALEFVGKVKKIYLFEGEKEIYETALSKTFEKEINDGIVDITYRFAGCNRGSSVRLDDVVEPCENLFIKMDVEGSEIDVLNSARKLIEKSENVRLTVACYHYKSSADELYRYLTERGFLCSFSKGYVVYIHDPVYRVRSKYMIEEQYPYFRKAVIRAVKNVNKSIKEGDGDGREKNNS